MSKKISTVAAINRALVDAMEGDSKVLVLGEDVGDAEDGGIAGITKGLSTRFGENRVRSTPISEQAIIGAAIGAAMAGYKPVAEIMLMNFTTVAMDMIVNHAAKLRFMSGGQTTVPLTIRTMTGTGLGSGGQHSDYLEAWFAHTAGLKVVTASNPADAYGLMRACIDDPDPCIIIENLPLLFATGEDADFPIVPIGKASIPREGTDVTIVSYSRMLLEALGAAQTLSGEGISAEVIDLRTISPWDRETVMESVGKTKRLLVVHEAVKQHGVGAEIAAEMGHAMFGKLLKPVERMGAVFSPVPFANPLETAFAPDAARIAERVRAMMA